MSSCPSPKLQTPRQLTDVEVGYSYVEFPDDTFFMESMAQNESFRPGVAYVPVQRYVNGQEESHLYEITASSSSTVAKHIAGPITAPDGNRDITIFGSALSSKGILYLCAFNRNSILAFDLNTLPTTVKKMCCTVEIRRLSSPNDVCLDPKNEEVLYVAGGTFRRACCCFSFSNSAYGRVYKIELSKHNKVSVQADDLNTLAGVEVVNDTIWSAQLFDILKIDSSGKPTVAWEGFDAQEQVWLADNIDTFGDAGVLVCPAYSTASAVSVQKIFHRSRVVSAALIYFQIVTAVRRGERLRTALRDPEVCLSFSNTYIESTSPPAPVRLIFIDSTSGATQHFEIDLVETRQRHQSRTVKSRTDKVLGQRHFFNEQVTHASHLRAADGTGFIACVNFEQPRILLLRDTIFRDAMTPKAVIE